MDLLNATAEKMGWWYDGIRYDFPPGDLVRVTEECGRHMLSHLSFKGLQEVKYGDDPKKVGLTAVRAIVAFHETQIAIHEANNAEQSQKKLEPLPEPEGVREARRRLAVYKPHYEQMLSEADEETVAAERLQMEKNLGKGSKIPEVEGQSIDELRETLKKLGGDPGTKASRKDLVSAIKKLVEDQQAKLANV